jgi:hypothetical protein
MKSHAVANALRLAFAWKDRRSSHADRPPTQDGHHPPPAAAAAEPGGPSSLDEPWALRLPHSHAAYLLYLEELVRHAVLLRGDLLTAASESVGVTETHSSAPECTPVCCRALWSKGRSLQRDARLLRCAHASATVSGAMCLRACAHECESARADDDLAYADDDLACA